MRIDPATELVGVVGHPVGHSLSPAFWNPALQAAGRNAVFLAFDVEPDSFATFVTGMAAAGARGLNVTIPHKGAAFACASRRSAEADATGAANVLVFERERDGITAHNTDVAGLTRAVQELHGDVLGARALVLGAGGAGRAACWALRAAGAEVLVTNRTEERAAALAEGMGIEAVPADRMPLQEVDILVNATSVGLSGDEMPVPAPELERAAAGHLRTVLDVVYRPQETTLVAAARRAGLRAADGLSMLVHQAAEAYRLFFSADPPVETMWAAATEAAGRTTRSD